MQSPFITIFLNMNENHPYVEELEMIIREILKQRTLGMKDETGVYVTPAFPKLVYTLDENNVYPGSKYFDLTVMAAKCTAKRMVPDYVSAKIMREEHQGNVFPPMGQSAHVKPCEPLIA